MTTASATRTITDLMWSETASIYDAILAHPFIKGLTSGDLERSAFEFYTVQDALYLKDYARALSLAAVKAPDEDTIILFNEHAKGCLVEERAMQENFFDVFGLSSEEVWATPKAPVCQAYTSYLLSVAFGRPFHEGRGRGCSPATGSTGRVGKALAEKGSPDPMYQQWIDTYAGEQFAECVVAVLEITNRVARGLPTEGPRGYAGALHHD